MAALTTVAVRGDERPDEPIKSPVLTFEQTDTAIKVHIRNVNERWGLRDQHVEIALWTARGDFPFHLWGPDEVGSVEGHPEFGQLHCCVITELRPGNTFTFNLLPSRRFRLARLNVKLADGPGWIKM